MKVFLKKGLNKGEYIDINYRIPGTFVYKAKRYIGKQSVSCYVHDNELQSFDRIVLRRSPLKSARSYVIVKLMFFYLDLRYFYSKFKKSL